MNSKTQTQYKVRIDNGSWLAPDGYSKYNERYKLAYTGVITWGEIYGYDQAVAHIEEYYAKQDEYTEKRQKNVLTIEFVTTIIKDIQVYHANGVYQQTN